MTEQAAPSEASLLDRWRTELFIAIWLLLTVAVIGGVIRYRRR